jgi:hypothetical protein
MKHPLLLLLFLFFGFGEIEAQFTNNYWAFGDSAGINWNTSLTPSFFVSNIKARGSSATIANLNQLLVYSALYNNVIPNNGYLWNKYNRPMSNGDHINFGGWYHDHLFIPHPINDSLIYFFSQNVTSSGPFGLFYSTINYKANNDSGIVIQKNVQLNNFPAFDALMAVRHGNGRDWWLIFQRWYAPNGLTPTNDFYIYLISPIGISNPVLQNIGATHTTGGGQLCYNLQGNQFANVSWRGLIELYNFDRCTGNISSSIPIEQEATAFPFPYYNSCAYSPDGTKLYVLEYSQTSAPSYLFQFDLDASNIFSSKIICKFLQRNINK